MPQQAFWRELLEGFSQLVNIFIKVRQNFIFYFLNNKAAKKFKSIGTYTENTDLILRPSNNYSSRDTVPLNVYILAATCIILDVSCYYNKFKQSIYLDWKVLQTSKCKYQMQVTFALGYLGVIIPYRQKYIL